MSFLEIKKFGAFSLLVSSLSSICFAGAVSGGGGGTLPADPVEPRLIREEMEASRNLITAYLRGVEMDRALYPETAPTRDHNFDKMFAPGTDVFKFLGEVQIFTRDTACHDETGGETDASANIDIEGGVCFSVARVHDKVGFTTYTAEIPALLLHEISHFYGTTEAEAVAIQKLAVRFFSNMDSYKVFTWNSRVMDSVKNLRVVTSITQQTLTNGGKINCTDLDDLSMMYLSSLQELLDGGTEMMLTSERDLEYYWQVETRVRAATDYLCGLKGFGDEYSQPKRAEEYNRAFGHKTWMSAREYADSRSTYHDPFNRYPLVTVQIKKCNSVADAALALAETSKDMSNLYETLHRQHQVKFNVH